MYTWHYNILRMYVCCLRRWYAGMCHHITSPVTLQMAPMTLSNPEGHSAVLPQHSFWRNRPIMPFTYRTEVTALSGICYISRHTCTHAISSNRKIL